jgi:hypothetical protein
MHKIIKEKLKKILKNYSININKENNKIKTIYINKRNILKENIL